MSGTRIVVIVILAVVALTLLRYRPWEGKDPTRHAARGAQHAERREALTVGFLPVT